MNKLVQEGYTNKLKNQLFGLLCEYEKNRDWENLLDKIFIELKGFPEESRTIDYYRLCYKISTLRYLSYKYFRATIFDCMEILSKGVSNE